MACSGSSYADVLVTSNFTDGTRVAGTDPLSVSWYTMGGPGTIAAVVNDNVAGGINSGNALKLTPSAVNQGLVAAFPVPRALKDGQALALSFQWRFAGATNLNQAGLFRFGLTSSGGTLTILDNHDNMRIDDAGYLGATNPGSASSTGTSVFRQTPRAYNPNNSGLLYSGSNTLTGGAAMGTAGTSVNAGTTAHTGSLTITRSGNSLIVTSSVDGQTTASATDTAPLNYVFDEVAFALAGGSVASGIVIDNVQVTGPAAVSAVSSTLGVFVGGSDRTDWTAGYAQFTSPATGLGQNAFFFPTFAANEGDPSFVLTQMSNIAGYAASATWNNNPGTHSMIPIVGVALVDRTVAAGSTGAINMMNAIAAGAYDTTYNNVLSAFCNSGRWPIIYLRIGWEQNGSWYPWSSCQNATVAAAYIAAWQHVATLARNYETAHPGLAVKTVWSPAVLQYSAVGCTGTWPGDTYVDVVAPDFYTEIWPIYESGLGYWKWTGNGGSYETSLLTWVSEPLNRAYWWDYPGSKRYFYTSSGSCGVQQMINFAIAHNKPFGLSETGCKANGGSQGPTDDGVYPYYLANRILEAQAKGATIEYVCPWNVNSPAVFKFTDGTRPLQLAAWRKYVVAMAANESGTGGGGGSIFGIRNPLADSYVRDGTYAGVNYGTATSMMVKLDASSYTRESYLRFDVSGLANAPSVKIVLTPVSVGTTASTLSYELLSDDTWTETGITWTNRPTSGTVLATATGYTVGAPVELDVTGEAHAKAAGNGLLSIRIRSTTSGSATAVDFATKENSNTAYRPVLEFAENRLPVADACVRDGTYASTNYGTDTTLMAKLDATSYTRESYLRFDVGDLTSASSVKLLLMPTSVGTSPATLSYELLTDDSWTETGITWNNRPTGSTVLGTATGYTAGTPVELDVTGEAHAHAAGDGMLSIRIRSTTSGSATWVTFGSKENTTAINRPVLEITP
ncbi:MAG: DNRLRE domain-containing protein [Opitutaceae bacterium]